MKTQDIILNQLPTAITDIQDHLSFGVVVSWGGGGSDLLNFLSSANKSCTNSKSCLTTLNTLLNSIEKNVNLTIKTLRAFAGSNTPILVRTQYNALRKQVMNSDGSYTNCDPNNLKELADIVLEGGPSGTLAGSIIQQGLNDRLRAIASTYSAKLVDTYPVFAQNIAQSQGTYIANDCIYPSNDGHIAISQIAGHAITGQ